MLQSQHTLQGLALPHSTLEHLPSLPPHCLLPADCHWGSSASLIFFSWQPISMVGFFLPFSSSCLAGSHSFWDLMENSLLVNAL